MIEISIMSQSPHATAKRQSLWATKCISTLVCTFLFTLGAFAPESHAAIVQAASCSTQHVAAAVAAASPGDTVAVPPGQCTWASGVTINKALSVVGAGSRAGGTILTASYTRYTGFFIIENLVTTLPVRISGFRFTMEARTHQWGIKAHVGNEIENLRIDHNRFDAGNVQIEVGGCKGVIDHNEFYNGDKGISFTAGSSAQASASWESMAAGTADALFVEDNSFIDDANYPVSWTNEKIGTYNGGKLVVRYNAFDFEDIPLSPNDTPSYPFGAHGSAAGGVANGYWQQGTGARRGQSVIEFYNNKMRGKRIDFMYSSRGSANLVHHNDLVTTAWTTGSRIYFNEEEGYETSNWTPLRAGWPAEDQVHNTFIWANTYQGKPYFDQEAHIAIPSATATAYIQRNRDYFLHEPRASGGSESFTGHNGASSTYPTDGVKYPTRGTMVFTPTGPNAYYGYVPYTYPHPLTAPSPPRNLHVAP